MEPMAEGSVLGLPVTLLGAEADPFAEKGTTCPGVLPPPSDPELVERTRRLRESLGEKVFVLGHHYQRDEVIQFADARGDSLKLSQRAAEAGSPYIVFCGVHFMAESADILTSDDQVVILPDLAAGCSMADMASAEQVEDMWAYLDDLGLDALPVTYMNSTAEIKALTGRKGGSICTSSNADKVMRWGLERAERVVFLPDEHLGRNISLLRLGLSPEDLVVWDPRFPDGGLSRDQLKRAVVVLWKGYCSVHQRFRPEHVEEMRRRVPGVRVIVHPECRHEVVLLADEIGSTEQIARAVRESPAGTLWAVGTELNLVSRLARENPDKGVFFLDRTVCFCSTMNRIDLPHLYRALVSIERGKPVNVIRVPADIKECARVALERMLTLA